MGYKMTYTFETSNYVAIGVEAVLFLALALILAFVWIRRTHEPVRKLILGAVGFLVIGLGFKAGAISLITMFENPISSAIMNNKYLYAFIIGGLMAGLFEETGRLIIFKTVLKKDTGRKTAITYGIGHGGVEVIYIALSVCLSYIAIMTVITNNGGDASVLTAGANEATVAAMEKTFTDIQNMTLFTTLMALIERVGALIYHISASVLVFASVREKRWRFLFPLMMLIHTAVDGAIVLIPEVMPIYLVETIWIISALLVALLAYTVYKKLED